MNDDSSNEADNQIILLTIVNVPQDLSLHTQNFLGGIYESNEVWRYICRQT